jgi:hypothetical protein
VSSDRASVLLPDRIQRPESPAHNPIEALFRKSVGFDPIASSPSKIDRPARAAVVLAPVSAENLCKPGIFADMAGDL